MNKKNVFLKNKLTITRLLIYLAVGTILSILVFFSTSFVSYLIDLDTFNTYASHRDFDIDLGFPYTYYKEEFIYFNQYPSTSTNVGNLLLDCTITWFLIAMPYVLYKIRGLRKVNSYVESEIIDQKEI